MANYHLTNKAVEDLANIWVYTIDMWSEQQADHYYNLLINSCCKIAENPFLCGVKYNEIEEGLLGYRAGRHIIFYRVLVSGDILVIRILHQRMDLTYRILE